MMPHAILLPLPAQGHINPMMQLAWKLVSDGFLVTFLNTDCNHQRIIQAANTNKSMHHHSDMIRMVSVPFELPPEVYRNDAANFLEALAKGMGPSVIDKLIREINLKEERKVSCIISDAWMCFGLQAVANRHRIPLAVFHTALLSLCALRYFSPRLVSLGILPSDGIPKEDKIVKYLPSLPPLRSGDLPWLYGGEYIFRKGIQMGEEIRQIKSWILFNSFYELEAPAVDELYKEVDAYPIGPLIPPQFLDSERTTTMNVNPSLWAEEAECLEWLDKQSVQSVIYVSFGSLAVLSERQMEELSLGLEATQRPFLWVVRFDLMDGNEAVLTQGFLERVKERGFMVSWAPQLRVLSHPSIACFVTHCGWNSVQESITMGVPMLCWPYFADQFLNRTYIVDVWNVGVAFQANVDGLIDKMEFAKCVERVVAEEEGVRIRAEVSKWKRSARNAVKEGGSSFNNYNLFVDAMKRQVHD